MFPASYFPGSAFPTFYFSGTSSPGPIIGPPEPVHAPLPRPRARVSSLVDNVLDQLQQDRLTPDYWTRQEIIDFLWEGMIELQLISGYLQTEVELPLTGNSTQAAPNQIGVRAIFIDGKALTKYSVDELDAKAPDWEDLPRTAQRPTAWAPIGVSKVVFHRRSTFVGAATFTMIKMPDPFTESTVIDLDEEFSEAITNYAFHVARLKEGGREFDQSLGDYQEYIDFSLELASRSNWKSAPSWSMAPKTLLAEITMRGPKPKKR